MATKKRPKRSARSGERPAWAAEADRWTTGEERDRASDAFLAGVNALITRRQPPWKNSEAELIGYQLAMHLWQAFFGVPSREWVARLRKALAVLDKGETKTERVSQCVQSVARWATVWKDPKWRATQQSRALWLKQAVDDLELQESAFVRWHDPKHRSRFTELLESYDASPAGKSGKRGADSILAVIVVETGGGLGFKVDKDEDRDDEAERIRKLVYSDVRKFFSRASTAENKP